MPTIFSRSWPPAAALLAAVLSTSWPGCAKAPPPAVVASSAPPAAPGLPNPSTAALALADPREHAIRFGADFQHLVARDPAAALAALRRLPRGREFSQGLLTLLDSIGRHDPDAALRLATELAADREEQVFYSPFFDRLARENLSAAVARLALVPSGAARENAVRALAAVWSEADPTAALAWGQTLPDLADRSAAVETALADLAPRDPRQAIELARKNLRPPALDRLLFRAVQSLAATDPGAATAFVPLLPPGELQTMAAAEVARALADRGVPAALTWVQTLPPDLTRRVAFNSVLTSWAQQDRDAAARHVLGLPPGPDTEAAASHLAPFLATDSAAAIRWAAALPGASTRSAAHVAIASAWAQRAPVEAVRWAATLNEDPLRPDALDGAFSYWRLHDAGAAAHWLDTAPLPAATKARLRR